MKTPFRRFMAYQRLIARRDIEARNKRARAEFEAGLRKG